MHELTLKLLKFAGSNNNHVSEEYAEFYIHDLNRIITDYMKDKEIKNGG